MFNSYHVTCATQRVDIIPIYYLLSHFCTWAFVQPARQSEQSADDSIVLCYQVSIATKRHAQVVSIHAKVYLLFRKGLGSSLFYLWHSSSSPRIKLIRMERKKELHQVNKILTLLWLFVCCCVELIALQNNECVVSAVWRVDIRLTVSSVVVLQHWAGVDTLDI